jgi:hypothetical protein
VTVKGAEVADPPVTGSRIRERLVLTWTLAALWASAESVRVA